MLLDRYEISYLPSARLLRASAAGPVAATERLLFVGFGAVNERAEWRDVAAAWRGPSSDLSGTDATKARVAKAAARAGILHVAAHAHVDLADPLAAYLRLAPGGGDDGLLNASEIQHLRIPARLVVLSACETDDGAMYRGAAPLGIARAFLLAGAQAVVGTQWPVGETAADLMPSFYRALAAGDRPAAALRTAKLALRRNPRTANPFFWAPYTLVETGGGALPLVQARADR